MKRLRKLWESIVYAGMQPSQSRTGRAAPQTAQPRGWLRQRWERFLAGGAQSDPLYLTNQSIFQKARTAIIVSVACLIVVGLVALGASHYFSVREKPVHQPTAAEIARDSLPDLVKGIQITTDHDLEVADARIQHGAQTRLVGTVKNNTRHGIENVRVVFTLTNRIGAKLGAVAVHVDHVNANSTAPFSSDVEQEDAVFALVREIHIP